LSGDFLTLCAYLQNGAYLSVYVMKQVFVFCVFILSTVIIYCDEMLLYLPASKEKDQLEKTETT